jgi:cytochrome P450
LQIPKGTTIAFNQNFILNDPKYWENPEVFNPKRFMDSGNCFNNTKNSAFIPFSTGKRMCIGDKFAKNSLFLILTNILQATNGYQFILADNQYDILEPKKFGFFYEPKSYKILIRKEQIVFLLTLSKSMRNLKWINNK